MEKEFIIEFVAVHGLRFLAALIVLIVGLWLAGRISRLVYNILKSRDIDANLLSFAKSFIGITLKILVVLSVLGMAGVQMTSFIAVLGAAGLAVGLALQGSLSNFAGGIIILLFKPYKVGDFVEAQGFMGTVQEVQIFHTIFNTPDNKIITIPNGALANGPIVNFSKQEIRRVEWLFGVAYGTDYDKAEQIIREVIKKDSRILSEPEPQIVMKEMADSSVNIMTRGWTKSGDFWPTFFDINKTIYKTFNEKGIEIPFPQVDVHMKKTV